MLQFAGRRQLIVSRYISNDKHLDNFPSRKTNTG